MIRYLLSKLLLIEAILLLVPVSVATYYQEASQVFTALFTTIGILILLGSLGILRKPKNQRIYTKEGVLIVALCWILWSFFGALPFVFSGQIPSVIDAFFEISSGFTTTGATILNDVSVLSRSLLFWRSFTHLIGGMGVLVFALAIMDNAKNSHLEVMKAEVPGPVFGKVVSKLKNTAQILYLLYLGLFSLFVVIYYLAGMSLFDSFVIAMGTAGTGGFTVYNDGIAHYGSSLITYLVSIGVLVFGVNFNLYYYLMLRRVKAFFGDEELRTYVIIVLVSDVYKRQVHTLEVIVVLLHFKTIHYLVTHPDKNIFDFFTGLCKNMTVTNRNRTTWKCYIDALTSKLSCDFLFFQEFRCFLKGCCQDITSFINAVSYTHLHKEANQDKQ